MLFFWVKWLHILATSVWFGINLMQAGDIRTALSLGAPHVQALVPRINRIHAVSLISGFITILTGFAMIFLLGGFGFVPGRIHAGLGLTLCLVAIEYLLVIGPWKKILAVISSGSPPSTALPFAKRYAMGTGIGHLLRTIIFAAMIIPF
jgi:hypothetical protein